MTSTLRILSAALCLFALTAGAATYIVPPDAEMIQKSDDIVIATGVRSMTELDARSGIVTRFTLRIDEVLKGDRAAGQELVLTERGGVIGNKAMIIAGTPRYVSGVRYLVFTSANRNLEPVTFGLSLGQFHLVGDLALRAGVHGFNANLDPHAERARNAALFIRYIHSVVTQRKATIDYFAAESAQIAAEAKIATNAFSATSYLMQDNGFGYRWATPAAGWVRAGTASGSGDPVFATATAMAQWNGTGTGINYTDAGFDPSATSGFADTSPSQPGEQGDGKNAILFGDPNDEVNEGSGVAGIGGIHLATLTPFGGTSFWLTEEAEVVMAATPFSQACMNAVLTHEVGHTLGFRHSDQKPEPVFPPVPCNGDPTLECTSDAIMNSSVGCSVASNLRPYDNNAASTVYGTPACNPPSIATQPITKNISLGQSTQLTVVAAGTGPFTYAWFIGNVGDTSQPVGTNSATITITPTVTTTYWVRVTNCSTQFANSVAATVFVSCASPQILNQPSSTNVAEGSSVTLQVGATGSSLTYQWYLGPSGDARLPVGANSSSLTITPSSTTQYWVRVSGACGTPVDSNTATVTVIPCAEVELEAPSSTPNPGIGNFRLNINAFSSATPLQFQWFRGTTPGFGGTLIASTQATNVSVTAATSFWARVTNSCGKSAVSALVTVAPCTLPSVATQPEDRKIVTGNTASLSLAVNGTGTTVKWYRGAIGDRTNEVGSGTGVTVGPLFANTTYWAELTNTCGTMASRLVTVTVDQATTNLFLLNRRFNVQVRYKNQFANPPSEGLLTGQSLQASTLSDTAIFWFDSPLVVELMVRVSDARPFDNAFHVYLGGLSDVEFFITVKDTVTGKSVEYHKLPNSLVGQIDRKSFPAGNSLTEAIGSMSALPFQLAANADTTTLRMLNRFDVRIRYRNQFASPATEGFLLGRSITKVNTTETAVFYFENPESVEWIVRFSDVRPFADRIDFFHGGLSDVEYTVIVKDTVTGQEKSYPVAPFSLAGGVDRQSYKP